MIKKIEAILSLVPEAIVTVSGDNVDWHGQPAPVTEAEIQAELARLQAEYDAKEYARKRAPEYPPLTELADAIYWQSEGDNTKMTDYLTKVELVKQKYPKD